MDGEHYSKNNHSMPKTLQVMIKFLPYENGGRVQLPEGTGYAPHFVVNGSNEYLAVRFNNFPQNAKAETDYPIQVELMYPTTVDYSNLKKGALFEVLEGKKTVATGTVL
jgi:translation elongation factor EF-Tu-like GTPase